jgi:hypothetical protein
MPKSKKNLSRELLPKLADALANSEEFCLLVKEFTSNRSDRLDTIVVAASAAIDYPEWGPSTSTGNAVVQSFTARLLHADPSTPSPNARRLQSMLSDRVTVKKTSQTLTSASRQSHRVQRKGLSPEPPCRHLCHRARASLHSISS